MYMTVWLLGPLSETPDNIDYEYAQQELMNAQMVNDPIQEAITAIEAQHEEEKQGIVLLEKGSQQK